MGRRLISDSAHWGFERELPVGRPRLELLAEQRGLATVWSPSSRWSGDDVAELLPHIVRVASAVLTDRALEIFLAAFAARESQESIARRLGIAHQTVQQSLHGARRRDGYWRKAGGAERTHMVRHGGSVSKVKKALAADADFLEAAEELEQPVRPDPRLYWFAAHLTPRHQNLIVPLTTLLLLDGIVDAQDVTTFDEACRHMPRVLLNAALTQLRLLGWVQTDGVAIKILWRPEWRPEEDE